MNIERTMNEMHRLEKALWMMTLLIAAAFMYFIIAPVESYAAEEVQYLQDGQTFSVTDYIEVNTENIPDNVPQLNGEINNWYVVKEDVTYNSRLDVTGTVNLILCDGATLTANKGIYVAAPYQGDLRIYAQSEDKEQMGKIIATGGENWAGIGGNNSGKGSDEPQPCGTVKIYGGNIKAVGGENGAGIGGAKEGDGGSLYFYGGFIDAQGGDDAAGIGGGEDADGGSITIHGGDIQSKGGEDGAGIGGGSEGSGGSIRINQGNIKTEGGPWGAGIGGGYYAHAGDIVINGGTIDSRGKGGHGVAVFGTSGSGAGIGAGAVNEKGDNNSDRTAGGTIIINGGKIYAEGGSVISDDHIDNMGGAGIGNGNDSDYGCLIEIHGGDVEAVPGAFAAAIGGGDDSYGGTIIIDNKVGTPVIRAKCEPATKPGASSEYYCFGKGDDDQDPSKIIWDYPNGKIWIHGHWGGSWADESRTVNADERASILACGSATYNRVTISPCDHPGKYFDKTETGHIPHCRHCSVYENAEEEAHTWGDNNKCTVCGYERQEPEVPHEHVWSDWETEAEADCSHEGIEIRTCETDPTHIERRTIPIDPGRHSSYGRRQENVKAATCTSYGEADMVVYCTACNETISVTHYSIAPRGHDWDEWVTVSEATATETGLEERVCKNDPSHKETRVIPVAGHEHKLSKVDAHGATCTENGIHEHWKCNVGDDACGRLFADEEGKLEITLAQTVSLAQGHQWSDEVKENEVAATCEKPASYDAVVYCEVCGEEMLRQSKTEGSALGHDWGDWTVTKQPTETEAGVRTHECSRCHEKETEAIPAKGYASGGDPNQMGIDGTPVGPGASEAVSVYAITHMPNDNDPAGTVYGKLKAKSTKQTKNSVNVKWSKVSGAAKYVIYGNASGTKNKMKKLATTTGKSKTFKKIAGKKVKKGTYYKFIIVALDKNNNVVSTSKIVHVATKGGKVGNHKSVTVKKSVLKKAKKLKKGKSLKLKAKAVKASKLKVKKHVAVRYESSNPKIATISKKGVVKGKNKGTCYIYAYAQNGVAKKIKVVVK